MRRTYGIILDSCVNGCTRAVIEDGVIKLQKLRIDQEVTLLHSELAELQAALPCAQASDSVRQAQYGVLADLDAAPAMEESDVWPWKA